MYSSQQALLTNEKAFYQISKFVFELSAEDRKIFKRIAGREY